MSAPDTNIEKQEKRHKGPLLGMPMAVVISAIVFVVVVAFVALTGTDDENADATDVTTATSGEAAAEEGEDATGTATD